MHIVIVSVQTSCTWPSPGDSQYTMILSFLFFFADLEVARRHLRENTLFRDHHNVLEEVKVRQQCGVCRKNAWEVLVVWGG